MWGRGRGSKGRWDQCGGGAVREGGVSVGEGQGQ